MFSVGMALGLVHSTTVFSRALCFDLVAGCVTPGGADEGGIKVTDSTNTFTYNLGFLFKPTETIKLGVDYRPRTDLQFSNAEVKFAGNFSPGKTQAHIRPVPLPSVIDASLFWQFTPAWSAEIHYEYTRWSSFERISAFFSPPTTFTISGLGFPIQVPIESFSLPQKWKNTNGLSIGSSYQLNERWVLRGGIGVQQTPVPDETLSPAIPAGNSLFTSIGLGYRWDRLTLDLGYLVSLDHTRRVNNNELEGSTATGIFFAGAAGKDIYKTVTNFLMMSVAMSFRINNPISLRTREVG
jgi:long-chain fatty acid transport protein